MRVFLLASILSVLAGCGGLRIDTSHTSQGQDSRVQFVILHYTSSDLPRSLATLTHGEVSSHYLISAKPPTIYRLVDENRRAWHAGESEWRGRTWLNASSIGIELISPGYSETADGQRLWYPYPDEQIDALILLLKDIVRRHGVPPGNIIGHSDIAPLRKVDPGPLFPWKRLADAGLIVWPDAREVIRWQTRFARGGLPDVAWFQQQLEQQGYRVPRHGELDEATRRVIAAFQMKYRPSRFDGEPDAETAGLLAVLNGDAPADVPLAEDPGQGVSM
ncbi:N-acetylmuramoyl-L-alanine amidase [Pseudomonas indica]|uniref:N-acetylmuramoyl-L-alanine amidase n=1 Tax=Pseudomonas indica TaxID=137658 RepID=A0A1G9FY63_9PSED|nr:N-acetylmuramoyl-L-alanine amidase [Pseudomonas indica]SDK93287.1 N-acetylmuramoyl-L-alanine amidase [Pseudomonas indica]